MKEEKIIHIICSPHGGLATFIKGFLEASSNIKHKSSIIINKNKSNNNFISYLESNSKNIDLTIYPILRTHKLPNLYLLFDIFKIYKIVKNNISVNTSIKVFAHGTSAIGISFLASKILNINIIYIPHGGLSHLYKKNFTFKIFAYLYDSFLLFLGVKIQPESIHTLKTYNKAYKNFYFLRKNIYQRYLYSFTRETVRIIEEFDSHQENSFSYKSYILNRKLFRVVYMGTWRNIKGAIKFFNIVSSFKKSELFLDDGRILSFDFYTDISRNKTPKHQSEFIKFHSWTSNPLETLKKYHCLVIPSIQESFGYAALEGILSNIPIIHTNKGGLSEILNDTMMPIIDVNFEKKDLIHALKQINSKYDYYVNIKNLNLSDKFIKNSYWKYHDLEW